MVSSKKSVLVFGLDGASPSVINRWIEELPTFNRFKEEGILGLSIPPIPAQTPVAWTTCMTGKNPGKHGIFSFAQRETGSYRRYIANPSLVQSDTLCQILSEYKKRVGVLNVPMSGYEKINGFMIPGFLDKNEGIPQPRSMLEKLRTKFNLDSVPGDVEPEKLTKATTNPHVLLDRIFEITQVLSDVGLYLIENEVWDLFITVFMGTDRLGHFFWKYIDNAHPTYIFNEFSKRALAYYKMIDSVLSKFLKTIPKETFVVLLSDHGFCPVTREVYLNNYLQDHGYIESKNGKISLENSRAVAYGYGDIWINVKGREPNGVIKKNGEYETVRNEIIQTLKAIKIEKEKPIQEVVKREEVYWGPYVSEASDLIAIFKPGWQSARRPEIINQKDPPYINTNPLWSGGHDGTHHPRCVPGILGFLDANLIKSRAPFEANLWDLAPTILKAMNIPIPKDMDGKALPIFK